MALIICPQCGCEVSDKASQCIHCGTPIMRFQVCEECGNKYPEQNLLCPNCGCPSTRKAFTAYSSEKEREIDLFLLTSDYYPPERYNEVKSWLMTLNDRQLALIYDMNYRDSDTMLLVAIFLGYAGLDRFLLKDTKNGLIKLGLTCCSFLVIPGLISIVWWIKDIFNIKEMVRKYNYNQMRKVPNFV